jgi:hypothetical protein
LKQNVARGGPASLRKAISKTSNDPLSDPLITPAQKRGIGKPTKATQV